MKLRRAVKTKRVDQIIFGALIILLLLGDVKSCMLRARLTCCRLICSLEFRTGSYGCSARLCYRSCAVFGAVFGSSSFVLGSDVETGAGVGHWTWICRPSEEPLCAAR
jgi:hypothetical protein